MAKKPSALKIYGVGLGATLVVYAVYYLRNPGALTEGLVERNALEIVLTLVAGGIVTFFGGFWALLNKPRDLHRAFMVGLGWPAIIFAADLGAAIESADSKVTPAGFFPASILAGAGDSPVVRGLRLGLAPVSSVVEQKGRAAKLELKRVRNEVSVIQADIRDLEKKKRELEGEVEQERKVVRERDETIQEQMGVILEQKSGLTRLEVGKEKLSSLETDLRRLWPTIGDGCVRAIEGRDPEAKKSAVRVVGFMKPAATGRISPSLKRLAIESPDLRLRIDASWSLINIYSGKTSREATAARKVAVEQLMKQLGSRDPALVLRAVRALGEAGKDARPAVDRLRTLARNSPHLKIQEEAKRALKLIAGN